MTSTPETKGARIMLGLMMGGLYMAQREESKENISPEAEESEKLEEEEKEVIMAGLAAATGILSPGSNKAITMGKLLDAIETDPEYKQLIRNLAEKLPWADTCKEYRAQKRFITRATGWRYSTKE